MTTSNIKYLLVTLFAAFSIAASGQSASKYDTLNLQVKGVCGMCQSRIELAVYDMKGVKKVDWDLDTEKLTTIVKSGKVTRQEIANTLAEAGHESELAKAKPESYKKLPDCCKYNDGVEKHNPGGGGMHHRK